MFRSVLDSMHVVRNLLTVIGKFTAEHTPGQTTMKIPSSNLPACGKGYQRYYQGRSPGRSHRHQIRYFHVPMTTWRGVVSIASDISVGDEGSFYFEGCGNKVTFEDPRLVCWWSVRVA